MKHVLFAIGLLSVALSSPATADCRSVVAATLAELKAAYPEWDDNMETLVRTAAGSACVKASTVEASTAAPAPAPAPAAIPETQLEEQAVSASGAVTPMAVETTTAAAETSASSETAASEADDDSDWNPFKDIKFNKVSASPNKKPYERRRDVNNTAPSADDAE